MLPDPSGGFSPCDDGNAEFIEIFNPGAAPVSLVDAELTDDGNQFTLTSAVSVPAGGYTVVARERAAYVACWGESAALHPEGYGFGLSNGGETLTLSLDGALQDTRTYGASNVLDGVSFQRDANGTSLCFSRTFAASGLVGTPGAANTDCQLLPLASSVAPGAFYDGSRTVGDRLRVQGLVVTAVDGTDGFFAQAPTGTSDAALYVVLADQGAAPAVGSTVDVTGWYRTLSPGSTLYAQPRLDASFFGDVISTGTGASLPAPVALGADAFSLTAGDYVAMRVTVSNSLGDLTVDAIDGGRVTLTDGFAPFVVDDTLYDWLGDVGTLSVGDTVTSVTGVVAYDDDTWLLVPTGAADIVGYTDL